MGGQASLAPKAAVTLPTHPDQQKGTTVGFVKSNIVPLAVGVAIGYFAVPYLTSVLKNR